MSDLEIQLRGAMDDLAADAPAAGGLLDAVQRRGRTVHRRRVVAGIAAAVVVAVVGGLSLATLTGDDEAVQRLRVATPGPATGSASAAPPSPVDAGWLPKGFPEPTVRLLGPGAWALDTRRDEGLAALQVQVMAAKTAVRTSPGELSEVKVGDTTGQLYWVPKHAPGRPPYGNTPPEAEGPYAELTFAREPGQWVRIIAQNSAGDVDLGITPDDLVRIATGLVDTERALPDAIRVGALPVGLIWSRLTNDDHGVVAGFDSPSAAPVPVSQEEQPNGHNGSVDAPLEVMVTAADDPLVTMRLAQRRGPRPSVAPEETTVARQDGYTYVVARLRSDSRLAVVVGAKDAGLGLTEAMLREIAEHTEIGPGATVRPTR